MKKFVSLLTSMIVTLFVIGCSNPSSSSGGSLSLGGAEDNGTKIYNNSVTLTSNPEQIVKPDDLKDLEINKLIITAYNFTTTSEEAWWVTLTADDSWTTKLEKDAGTWSDENQGWSWTVTDSETLSKFKEGGIYIAGTAESTVTITVSYK